MNRLMFTLWRGLSLSASGIPVLQLNKLQFHASFFTLIYFFGTGEYQKNNRMNIVKYILGFGIILGGIISMSQGQTITGIFNFQYCTVCVFF